MSMFPLYSRPPVDLEREARFRAKIADGRLHMACEVCHPEDFSRRNHQCGQRCGCRCHPGRGPDGTLSTMGCCAFYVSTDECLLGWNPSTRKHEESLRNTAGSRGATREREA